MKYQIQIFLIYILFFLSCSDDSPDPGPNPDPNPGNPDWLISFDQVFDGGPGKDGIPSIDDPSFSEVAQIDFLNNDDLILGIRVGDEVRAYPHPILDWHEIVNDKIGEDLIALTYCPLTGTGIGWNRIIEGVETTFGVSGLLYNTNLMPYDRATNSTWSQQRLDCVNGANIGINATLHTFVETSWETWKQAFPDSKVMNTNTGFSRNYSRYPYGDYRTNNNFLLFPVSVDDDRLPAKERVLGVRILLEFKAYTFANATGLEVFKDTFNDKDLIIVRSTALNYLAAFENPLLGLEYEAADEDEFPTVIKDANGRGFDILGHATDGSGDQLIMPSQLIGYWFSWGTFYPNLELHPN